VTGNTFNPTVAGPGIHTITYSFTAGTGCSQANATTIEVYPTPTSTFTLDNSICVDGTSTLQSTGTISSGSIATWNWNLGDGNTPSYSNSNPFNISYTAHNNYNISLVTTSDRGCVSTTTTQTIGVHPLPIVGFDLPEGICMPQGNALFTNTSSVPDNSALSYVWDFGDLSAPSSAINASHVYAASGSYNVTLTATSAFGCSNQDVQILDDFYDKPIAVFRVSPSEICQGSDIAITNISSDPNGSNLTYAWNFGDNTSSTVADPTKTYAQAGDFTISLIVTNAVGCASDPFEQYVKVHLQPVIDAGPSYVVPQGSTIQFAPTVNSGNLTFSWDPSFELSNATDLQPTLIAMEDRTYTLTATGDFGCTASDFLTVKILKPVKVPNVFSPNGDNIHDKWVISNLADYPNAEVEVFNRYGQQVFRSTGYGTPWDGRFNGKDLPVGTYYYVIRLNSGFAPMSGSLTILR
jgi:gliding motility-associated-like protein